MSTTTMMLIMLTMMMYDDDDDADDDDTDDADDYGDDDEVWVCALMYDGSFDESAIHAEVVDYGDEWRTMYVCYADYYGDDYDDDVVAQHRNWVVWLTGPTPSLSIDINPLAASARGGGVVQC